MLVAAVGAEIKVSHESHGIESHRDFKSVLRQNGRKTIKSKESTKKVSWSLGGNSEGINVNGQLANGTIVNVS
jgi:hypothetical protein